MKTSLKAQEGVKSEAIQLLEEVAKMATSSHGNAGEQMRNRIHKLELQWKQLEEEIEGTPQYLWIQHFRMKWSGVHCGKGVVALFIAFY